MSDNFDLLNAILQDPNDEARRLIYADWLEEQGEADLAGFIRIQLERYKVCQQNPWYDDWHWSTHRDVLRSGADYERGRARFLQMQSDCSYASDEVANFSAAIEEGKLRDEFSEQALDQLPGVDAFEFQRGLIERVAITPQNLLTHAEELFREVPVLDLTLLLEADDSADVFAEIFRLPQLAQLTCLHVAAIELAGIFEHATELAIALGKATHMKRLNALWLGNLGIKEEGMAHLANSSHLQSLTELYVGGNYLHETGVRHLTKSPHLRNLRTLFLSVNSIQDEGARLLAEWPGLSHVTMLDLGANRIGVDGLKALANSQHLSNVSTLYLDSNLFGNDGMKALAQSPYLTKLKTLELSQTSLKEEGIRYMAGWKNLSTLRQLGLRDSFPDDAGIIALAESPHLQGLEALHLAEARFGGEGLAALLTSGNLPFLNWLNLSRIELEPGDLDHLPDSGRDSSLDLDLSHNPLGDEGIQLLAQWPGLQGVVLLDLSETEMGDDGAAALVHSEYADNLVSLVVWGHEMTGLGITNLYERFGEANVHVDVDW